MSRPLSITMSTMILAVAAFFAMAHNAHADDAVFDVDSKFRAKIAKEKVKQSARERESSKNGKIDSDAECGSQSIGNVDTGGKIGAAPREIFVFAPNAINLVSGRGCR